MDLTKSAKVQQWKKRNPEKTRENAVRSYHRRKEIDPLFEIKHQLAGVKSRAKLKGIAFELTLDELLPIPQVCPVLGISLHRDGGKGSPNLPELDRLVPSLGYVKGNVQWISRKANTIKSNATYEELELVTGWVREQFSKTCSM